MDRSARLGLATAIAIVASVVIGASLLRSPAPMVGSSESPSTSASTVTQDVVPTIATLDGEFVSPSFGYRVSVPAAWTVHPATIRPQSIDDWGMEGGFDWLTGDGATSLRFIGTVAPPPSGVTPQSWIASARADAARGPACSPSRDDPTIDVDGHAAVIVVDDCDRLGTYSKWSRAVLPTTDRIYLFQLDANADPTPILIALLRTLHLPEEAP